MKVKISASILSADFGKLNEEIKSVEPYVDLIHVDVMDGHFVPNLTIGSEVVSKLKSEKPLECHLMIENPDEFVDAFAKAGAKCIIVHQETCPDLAQTIQHIKELGCYAGVSINPATPVAVLKDILDYVDMVLLMTVNPGFGGQAFIESVLDKISELRGRSPLLDIEVDGGINKDTAKLAVKAGANILVSGSYIFKAKDRKKAIETLKF